VLDILLASVFFRVVQYAHILCNIFFYVFLFHLCNVMKQALYLPNYFLSIIGILNVQIYWWMQTDLLSLQILDWQR